MTDEPDIDKLIGLQLSCQQSAAVRAPLAPGVVIAGAGTGKTTLMAARVVWLVASGQAACREVLGLTFTRKAAAELAQRVRAALDAAGVADGDDHETVLTYDAFARQLVVDHGLALGVEADFRLLDEAARYSLAHDVVTRANGPFEQLGRLQSADVARAVLELSAQLRSNLSTPQAVREADDALDAALGEAPLNGAEPYRAVAVARDKIVERRELLELVEAYEAEKASRGFVEYADLLAHANDLAGSPRVAAGMRDRFRVVLLDEYQDTSAAQAQLLRQLFSGPTADAGRGHPVMAVGDPSQAIYGWRGAAADNISDFPRHFPNRDGSPAAVFPLTVNRRSGPSILAAANELARGLPERRTDLALDLSAPPGTAPGVIETKQFQTQPEELAWVADAIAAMGEVGALDGADVAWADIAVLARTNAVVAAVHAELVARGVPAEVVGLGGLLKLPPIAQVLATLRILDDERANAALVEVLACARWAIGPSDLALLGRRAAELAGEEVSVGSPVEGGRGEDGPNQEAGDEGDALGRGLGRLRGEASLARALADPGALPYSSAARRRFRALAAELAGLRPWVGRGLSELVERVVAALGLEVELLARGQSVAVLEALIEAVADFEAVEPRAELGGLLAYFDAELAEGVGLEQPAASEANSVKLLTIHKAKGL
ncbi:MAG: ATP-dependent helicase, partial [Propionibacteriaceae bacterium]|nr:ATP-dependent helicase [Propionibacteriaceae bacterium]